MATACDVESTTCPLSCVTTDFSMVVGVALFVCTEMYIVSAGANTLAVSTIRLLASMCFPVSMVVTTAGAGGAGAAATESAGGTSSLRQPMVVSTHAVRATASGNRVRIMV